MALTSECEKHGWSWDPADDMGCPICYGIAEEQERIIKLLEELDDEEWMGINQNFIALIKGENK